MRLTVSFVVLLVMATTASTLLWEILPPARAGDGSARVMALVLAPVAFVGVVLLARMILRIYEARHSGRGSTTETPHTGNIAGNPESPA